MAEEAIRTMQQQFTSALDGLTRQHSELQADWSIPDSTDGAQEFRDRSTGLPLNPEMVKKARELQMQYMDELKVLEDSDRDTCMAETVAHRSRLTGSTSRRAIRSDPIQKKAGLSRDTWAVNK